MNSHKRKWISIIITIIISWLFLFLSIEFFEDHAYGAFVLIPSHIGFTSTLIYTHKNNVPYKSAWWNAFITLTLFCISLLSFGTEGIICVLMVAPLAIVFTWIGFLLAYRVRPNTHQSTITPVVIVLITVPALMAFENQIRANEKLRTVKTSIIINASPAVVWKNVIAFPQLDPPTELMFKAGIAYPINAKIDGEGVGAIRYCNFSTGPFVEPVTKWEPGKLLAFDVVSHPDPMTELSPYNIRPKHMEGHWVSRKGEFKLTKLEDGRTLVEGTTWYTNRFKPAFYWNFWSDMIVHKIHNRVLQHIKKLSEKQ